jgi:hypothetical protein
MILDTRNGHDAEVIKKFNESVLKIDDHGLLEFILVKWADDDDLLSMIEELKEQ